MGTNVYGKGVALATLDNSASNRYNNNINVMEGAEENGRTVRNADIGNGVGRPQSGLDTVDSTREYDSDGSAELPKIVRLSPKTQEALSQSGVVSLELVDSSDNSSAFSVALDEARASDKENGWAVTPKSAEELVKDNVRTIMTSDRKAGLDFVLVGHFDWNKQSARVIEKCGFQYIKTRPYETRRGTTETALEYIRCGNVRDK